ncbi:CHAP domain-containing protein [Candidatus Saccharibacteria bacterium]|nr:CHAP domain-containing protein [Candidatus Saccharibacteria bacterium]
MAEKYKGNAALITTYNDLEISGLNTGLKIVIPNGELPTSERPGYVAPVSSTSSFITGYSSGAGNGSVWRIRTGTPNNGNYAWGNCTAYAFDRRADLGRPIGANWGNAGSWAWNALNAGYVVNRTPAVGAVIQDWGHVAIVEKVLPNGDLELSEMNYYAFGASGANNVVSGRILPAAYAGQYMYIH